MTSSAGSGPGLSVDECQDPAADADHFRVKRSGGWNGALYVVRLLALAYLSAAGSLLFWSRAPQVIGWTPRVVISGSMLPSVRPGDVALIEAATPGPATLPRGRIVLVRDPSRSSGFYLHRVVRYGASGRLVTKGDANSSEDWPAVDAARVAGQARLVVPAVGLPMLWWRDHDWAALAGAAAATWAAVMLALGLRRPHR